MGNIEQLDKQYYFVFMVFLQGGGRILTGSGKNCTPKLYTLAGAKQVITSDRKNQERWNQSHIRAGREPQPIVERYVMKPVNIEIVG